MSATSITDELLNDAFELAYFILGDRTASLYVVMSAVDKLKAASTIQGRRQFYTPIGRSSYPATRNRITLGEIHLLQRLIYVESDLFEKLLEEQQQFLHHEDLIIRYVKHLIRVTTKHNSFYVALGLCRLLYNYTTSETAEIYNLVIQDPVRMRDDPYYRRRKKRLMEQMKDRFGNLIRSQRGFRREERFQTEETSEALAQLIKQCLTRFTPWQSACVLPDDFDPQRNPVPALLFEGSDPDKEHEIDLNRIHTLTHPDCLERVTTALGIDPPERRLEVPRFFVSHDGPPLAGDRFTPHKLSEGELNLIKRHLDHSSQVRRAFTGAELICLIDQQRVAVFQPSDTPSITFDINDGAELLEIRCRVDEEEVPLALLSVDLKNPPFPRRNSTVILESGQKLTFKIEPPTYDSDRPASARMIISYEKGASSPAVLGTLRRLNLVRDQIRLFLRQSFLRPALAILFLVLGGASLWSYLKVREGKAPPPPSRPQAQARNNDTNSPAIPATPTKSARPSGTPQVTARRHDGSDKNIIRPPRLVENNAAEPVEETRGKPARHPSSTLASVKLIYVDSLGDDSVSQELRQGLIAAAQLSEYFTVTANRNESNAVFQGTLINQTKSSILKLELVDRSGTVIWSFSRRLRKQSLNSREISAQIVSMLLKDIKASTRTR